MPEPVYVTALFLAALALAYMVAVAWTQHREIRRLALYRDELRAEVQRCRETHVGELETYAQMTRPASPPPLDALVQPLGIFPINPPYRRSN